MYATNFAHRVKKLSGFADVHESICNSINGQAFVVIREGGARRHSYNNSTCNPSFKIVHKSIPNAILEFGA